MLFERRRLPARTYRLKPPVPRQRAFTVIEILLVVVVIGIALGIAMPSFVRTIQGHRLRTAARTLVTVARYARSMAILKQSDLAITFNLDTGQVDMTSTNMSLPRFTRVVEGVTLGYVEIVGSNRCNEGACTITYTQNGICQPFAVMIRDARGNYALLNVDALSSIRTLDYGKLENPP